MSEGKLTNHQMFAIAMESHGDKTLTTREIEEILLAKFPNFSHGSILPNDHSDTGNKNPCWCARTDNRIFDRVARGKFKVVYRKSIADDINDIQNSSDEVNTTKEALIYARIGQGRFRKDIINYWKCCAVTGISLVSILKASHIKPWRNCNNSERLDPFNGLLLSPNLDALFDLGYISFNDDGKIIISPCIQSQTKDLGLETKMMITSSKLTKEHRKYLKFHRDKIYIKSSNEKTPP